MADAQGQFKCDDCKDRGWILAYNTESEHSEIQRCDACNKYGGDMEAWETVKQALQWAAHEAQARSRKGVHIHLSALLSEMMPALKPQLQNSTMDKQMLNDFKEVEGRLFFTPTLCGRYEGEVREVYVRQGEPMILVRVTKLLEAKRVGKLSWTRPYWGVEVVADPTMRAAKLNGHWVDGTSRNKDGQVKEHLLKPLRLATRDWDGASNPET